MKTLENIDNQHAFEINQNLEGLISKLKSRDSYNLKTMRNFKWMYFILMIVYTLLIVVNPDPDLNWIHRVSGICYVLSFILFWLLFKNYQKEFVAVDYSSSVLETLKKGADRYKFAYKNILKAIPALLLIDIGLTLSFVSRHEGDVLMLVLSIQAIFIPVLCFSGFIGYLIWRQKEKPLRDRALEMLKGFDE